jgi:hypothetical protein
MSIHADIATIQRRMDERLKFMSSEKMPLESKLWMVGAQKRDWQRVKALRTQLEVRRVAPSCS